MGSQAEFEIDAPLSHIRLFPFRRFGLLLLLLLVLRSGFATDLSTDFSTHFPTHFLAGAFPPFDAGFNSLYDPSLQLEGQYFRRRFCRYFSGDFEPFRIFFLRFHTFRPHRLFALEFAPFAATLRLRSVCVVHDSRRRLVLIGV